MSYFSTFEEYRRSWDDAYETTPAIPLNVDIELASLCNLSCPFCFVSDGSFDESIRKSGDDGKSRRRFMPREMALKIIDQAAELGVPALKFNWRGESTLHPNFSEIILYAKGKRVIHHHNAWVKEDRPVFHELLVNTNGNCQDHAMPGLMACTKVMVSLDSMSRERYKIMRRGGHLMLAKTTINNLVDKRHPDIWVRRVITKENEHEDFKKAVKNEWGDRVKVSEHYCFDRNKVESHERKGKETKSERRYCGYPSQRIIVSADGFAYPCCIDLKQEMPFGDIRKEKLQAIWEKLSLEQLRTELKDGIFISDACKNCQSWMAYDSPKRDFVQDRELK